MIVPLLTFVLVANPRAFKFTRGIFGDWVAGPEGLATIPGLLLHALVFLFLVKILGPGRSQFTTRGAQQDQEIGHWQGRNELTQPNYVVTM
jgi:hypothetical protein